MNKTEEKENECCFENIGKAERVGRAQYRCPVCKKDSPMNQPTWEEEFDKNLQWVEIDGLQIKFVTMKNTYIDLKSFVRKTLSQQRKEIVERLKELDCGDASNIIDQEFIS